MINLTSDDFVPLTTFRGSGAGPIHDGYDFLMRSSYRFTHFIRINQAPFGHAPNGASTI